MSGPPRVRLANMAEPENKVPVKQVKKAEMETKDKKGGKVAAVLRQKSMNASCSSDASSDSSHSRASLSSRSSGRVAAVVTRRTGVVSRKKQCVLKVDKDGKIGGGGDSGGDADKVAMESGGKVVVSGNCGVLDEDDCSLSKKRCAWVTPSTDQCYATFHDEEWAVPVHDDKKLFELLSLSGALAELTWPVILNKRHIFREVFLDFDPVVVSKLNEKKIAMPGSPASALLSELKLRSIIENARQMCKVIDEFGSFDEYIWNFVNHKPLVNQFRYPRQVPVKTPKAEFISKDLVRRGFRSVGPTVIYSFMQVAGLTNDHLIICFRYQECMTREVKEKDDGLNGQTEKKELDDAIDVELSKAVNDLIY